MPKYRGAPPRSFSLRVSATATDVYIYSSGFNYRFRSLQISDLHLSRFHAPHRTADFRQFCNENIEIIKPEVVLVTGDLTDAKHVNQQGSEQFADEWQMYNNIITETGVLHKTVWLDIRGNHDAFDVPSLLSPVNYYKVYSNQGKKYLKHYRYEHRTKDGNHIQFIGADSCPDPGPRRPFNFFGFLKQSDLEELQYLSSQMTQSNRTIWFGHYPTSTIYNGTALRRLIRQYGGVYMIGHLHTLLGWIPQMYSTQRGGAIELEVGDWKDNRIYRVFAIDHDLMSFTDESFGTWPIILITNPKNAKFLIPLFEPTKRILNSTHMRVLVFSKEEVTTVQISLDGTLQGEAEHVSGSLYVLAWQPRSYSSGSHEISVTAKDVGGNERTVTQPFILDDTTPPTFRLIQRFILMTDFASLARTLFFLAFITTVLPLVIVKLVHIRLEVSASGDQCGCLTMLFCALLRRYQLICNSNKILWPLLGFHLYVAVGPWFVGEILSGYVGLVFVHGIYVNNTFIHGTLTYAYGFFQIMTFNLPLTLYIGWCLDQKMCAHKDLVNKKTFTHRLPQPLVNGFANGFPVALVIFQIYLVITGFLRSYGTMAAILGPVRSWSVFLVGWLLYTVHHTHRTKHQTHHTLVDRGCDRLHSGGDTASERR